MFVILLGPAYLFIELLAIIAHLPTSTAQESFSSERYGLFESCNADMQRDATNGMQMWQCQPRDQLVTLELPNATYNSIVPRHVVVQRCGGTCSANSMYKSCLPTSITYRNVDVLLVPHETGSQECSTVRVEQHESCGCSCKTTAENCSEIHRFVPRECKCVCASTDEKLACQGPGHYWDETLCACLCRSREEQLPHCPTGYAFNPSIDTCACVSVTEIANLFLEILIVVLVSSMALISVGLVQCYRTKTGLFKEETDVSRRINEHSSLTLTSIRRPPSEDHTSRSRHSTGSPKFMTLNELRSLFRMLSRTSRVSNPSSPTSPTFRAPPSDGRSFLSPNINYIPISAATSRSQSSTSVTTTADDISRNQSEANLLSSTASPNGPSRIPTICEALNELDDDEVSSSESK